MLVTADPISLIRSLAAGLPTEIDGTPLTLRLSLVPLHRDGRVLDSRRLLISDIQDDPDRAAEIVSVLMRRHATEPSVLLLQPNALLSGRGDADTPLVSCVWLDLDGKALAIAESYRRLEQLSRIVPPVAVVRSGSIIDGLPKLHASLRVHPVVAPADALPVWHRFAAWCGGDSACVTPSHAVGIAYNWKSGVPILREGLLDPGASCTLADLVAALDSVGAPHVNVEPRPAPVVRVAVPELVDVDPTRAAELLAAITDPEIRTLFAAGWSPAFSARWPSWSHADLAGCGALASVGASRPEAEEIWLSSQLGAREKAHTREDYRTKTLDRAFASMPSIIELKSIRSLVWFDARATFNAAVISGPFAGEKFRPAISIRRSTVWAHAFASAGLPAGEDLDAAKQLVGRRVRVELERSRKWIQVSRWLSSMGGEAAAVAARSDSTVDQRGRS